MPGSSRQLKGGKDDNEVYILTCFWAFSGWVALGLLYPRLQVTAPFKATISTGFPPSAVAPLP